MKIREEEYRPRGVIEIYEVETGKKVYETHNMIVTEGRDLIIKAVFNGEGLSPERFRMFADNCSEVTKYDMTISTIVSNGKTILFSEKNPSLGKYDIITNEDGTTKTDISNYIKYINGDVSFDNTSIKADLLLSGNINNFSIFGIGLIYDNGDVKTISNSKLTSLTADNTDYKLFSRAYIDPVFLRPNLSYLVHYTIYF